MSPSASAFGRVVINPHSSTRSNNASSPLCEIYRSEPTRAAAGCIR